MVYNFNVSPRNGKTYYENCQHWKYVKYLIKNKLDEKNSSKYEKCLFIIGLLEDFMYRQNLEGNYEKH